MLFCLLLCKHGSVRAQVSVFRSFWPQRSEWTGSRGVWVLIRGRDWSQAGHLQGCLRGPQVEALCSETKCLHPGASLLWDMREHHVTPFGHYLMIPTHKQIALNHSFKSWPRRVNSPLPLTLVFNSLPFLHLFLSNDIPLLSPLFAQLTEEPHHTLLGWESQEHSFGPHLISHHIQ